MPREIEFSIDDCGADVLGAFPGPYVVTALYIDGDLVRPVQLPKCVRRSVLSAISSAIHAAETRDNRATLDWSPDVSFPFPVESAESRDCVTPNSARLGQTVEVLACDS